MAADVKVKYNKPARCCLDEQECVTVKDMLVSLNSSISEEHVWALCYQCAKSYKETLAAPKDSSVIMSIGDLCHVRLHKDGYVHETTMYPVKNATARVPVSSEQNLVVDLGRVIYYALDFGYENEEERTLSPELGRLIDLMMEEEVADVREMHLDRGLDHGGAENDDEGIERDSDESEMAHQGLSPTSVAASLAPLDRVLKACEDHIGKDAAATHYRAVCRALVAERLELSTFLMKVSKGTRELRTQDTASSCAVLDNLHQSDWARFWMQVIGELRMGVQLKKVNFSRTPIEYELTPYEILMDDIRSRRYQLRKIMIDGNIPHRVKKDAHNLILDFIRSRPPLRKASERKLAPLVRALTPRERLLDSIKQGSSLKPVAVTSQLTSQIGGDTPTRGSDLQDPPKPKRRLITVDFVLRMDDDDDDDDDDDIDVPADSPVEVTPPEPFPRTARAPKPWTRTDSPARVPLRPRPMCSHDEYHQFCDTTLESYDLATQCPSRRASMRRHTIVACGGSSFNVDPGGSQSVPQSRPSSRQSVTSNETNDQYSSATPLSRRPAGGGLGVVPQELTWSRTSLQDELVHSKQWQEAMSLDERLSLTLEELVHIRSVLTKAELEGLPVEGQVKDDVEKRKVCFLCLKTRFRLLGPWGQRCKLCKRTVCSKCHSKMRIPTEHFGNVPVVLLSPSLGSLDPSPRPSSPHSPEATPSGYNSTPHSSLSNYHTVTVDESFPRSLMARLLPETENKCRNSVGSAPNSPNKGRLANPAHSDVMTRSMDGRRSLPPLPPVASPRHALPTPDRRSRRSLGRATTMVPGPQDRLRGEPMSVCHDCKGLVLQIIRSSRPTRSALRNHAIQNLTLNLAPVY